MAAVFSRLGAVGFQCLRIQKYAAVARFSMWSADFRNRCCTLAARAACVCLDTAVLARIGATAATRAHSDSTRRRNGSSCRSDDGENRGVEAVAAKGAWRQRLNAKKIFFIPDIKLPKRAQKCRPTTM